MEQWDPHARAAHAVARGSTPVERTTPTETSTSPVPTEGPQAADGRPPRTHGAVGPTRASGACSRARVHARRANDADGNLDVTRTNRRASSCRRASATHTATPPRTKPTKIQDTATEERREPSTGRTPPAPNVTMHPNASSGTQRQQRDRQTDPQAVTLRANTRTQRTAQTAPRPRSGRFGSDITPTHAIIRTPAARIQQHESSADRTGAHPTRRRRETAYSRRPLHTVESRAKPARTTKRPDQSSRPIPERMEQSGPRSTCHYVQVAGRTGRPPFGTPADPHAPAAHTDALGVHARRANDADGNLDVTRTNRRLQAADGVRHAYSDATPHEATKIQDTCGRTPRTVHGVGHRRRPTSRMHPNASSGTQRQQRDGQTGPQDVTLRANDRTSNSATSTRPAPAIEPAHATSGTPSTRIQQRDPSGHRTQKHTQRHAAKRRTTDDRCNPRRAPRRFRNAWSRRTRSSRYPASGRR